MPTDNKETENSPIETLTKHKIDQEVQEKNMKLRVSCYNELIDTEKLFCNEMKILLESFTAPDENKVYFDIDNFKVIYTDYMV